MRYNFSAGGLWDGRLSGPLDVVAAAEHARVESLLGLFVVLDLLLKADLQSTILKIWNDPTSTNYM